MELIRWDKEKNIIYFRQNGVLYKAKIIEFDEEKNILQLYVFNTNKTVSFNLDSKKNLAPRGKSFPGQILSPISGRVTKIFARIKSDCRKTNEPIKKGKSLLIIESMKMENEICAPSDLFVKNVPISEGDLVKQNQLLVEIEPTKKVAH